MLGGLSAYMKGGWRECHLLPSHSGILGGTSKETNRLHGVLPTSIPKRYMRHFLSALISIAVLYSYARTFDSTSYLPEAVAEANVAFPQVQETSDDPELPPLYHAYRDYEDQISVYNVQVTVNNTAPRYIHFANHAYGCGWGNVLQDMVFDALLAAEVNLGYVWDDYTWSKADDYSEFNGKKIPARIPISTMLSGHILGLNPQLSGSTLPRAISEREYEIICPPHQRTVINKDLVNAHLHEMDSSIDLDQSSGEDVIRAWLSYLRTPKLMNAQCVEVQENTPMTFDIWLFGSTRIQTLWHRLSRSPVLTQWRWSPLIRDAFGKNVNIFVTKDLLKPPQGGFFGSLWNHAANNHHTSLTSSKDDSHASSSESEPSHSLTELPPNSHLLNDSAPLPILVLHLRRGDFVEHCSNLAEWESTFTGFNSFPEFRLRDPFDVPRIDPSIASKKSENQENATPVDVPVVASKEERKRVYALHCLPDTAQIAQKVRDILHDYEKVLEEEEKERIRVSHWWSRTSLAARRIKTKPSRKALLSTKLKKVYIMTNGDRTWLADVKKALIDDAARSIAPEGSWDFRWTWDGIFTSKDLHLGWEEKPVAQALDAYVANRAEVFIGNGFSSLTSNIVMLRKQNAALRPVQTRFW